MCVYILNFIRFLQLVLISCTCINIYCKYSYHYFLCQVFYLYYLLFIYLTNFKQEIYYTILYYTILYYTILYYTILYYTILYYTILYYTKYVRLNIPLVYCWSSVHGHRNQSNKKVQKLCIPYATIEESI